MKRYVMAYGIARASDLASFRNTPQPVLAAWTLLRMRWPALARWLRGIPIARRSGNLTRRQTPISLTQTSRS